MRRLSKLFVLISVMLTGATLASAQAARECSQDIIAKMARGGMTDVEIASFCANAAVVNKKEEKMGLRKDYGILEGKNWQTHFLYQNKAEVVTFTVKKEGVAVSSTNPNAEYFEVEDLGDALRFKRKEAPYAAVYTLTIKMSQITETSLTVNQQYKTASSFNWKTR